MDKTLITLICSAMVNCQSKQNWIMAAAFGFNSFMILNRDLVKGFPHHVLYSIILIIIMAGFFIFFILREAIAHKNYAQAVREYLDKHPEFPQELVAPFKFEDKLVKNYSGSIAYILLVFATSICSIIVIVIAG